ncbi:sulfotransferase family protein [Flagellimonas myxillae]|uniref:sulfotransferase family protein n=1 Tax=Flagellimonas myxillae TaxID=2942214 RepID=UPI00201F754E|nr:sulfotransferase [Muricauda myxillae]MCL6266668.1 sulfotransferase [Muricauda myxillae]
MKHVYITGCPRSGTTMLASILGSCENCVATPESDFLSEAYFKISKSNSEKLSREELVQFLDENYRFKQWDINPQNLPGLPEATTASNFNGTIEHLVEQYAAEHSKQYNGQIIRIDHTPSSIKFFDVWSKQFPEAVFVYIVRDPRAVFASVKNLDWGANTALRLSELWIEYVALYYALKQQFPNKIMLVKYEDVVSNPSLVVKDVCAFAGLKYDEKILNGDGFTLPKYTASQHKLVGKSLTKERINKWKNQISEKDISIIEGKCHLIMDSFGYDSLSNKKYSPGMKDKVDSILKETYTYWVNKYKKRKRERIDP